MYRLMPDVICSVNVVCNTCAWGPPSGCGANNQPLSLLIGRVGPVFFKPELISYAGKVARYKHIILKQLRHYRCAWQVFLSTCQPIIPEIKTPIPNKLDKPGNT